MNAQVVAVVVMSIIVVMLLVLLTAWRLRLVNLHKAAETMEGDLYCYECRVPYPCITLRSIGVTK